MARHLAPISHVNSRNADVFGLVLQAGNRINDLDGSHFVHGFCSFPSAFSTCSSAVAILSLVLQVIEEINKRPNYSLYVLKDLRKVR